MSTPHDYPKGSLHDTVLTWGRGNRYIPSIIPSGESRDAIQKIQAQLVEISPTARLTAAEKLHATLFFCPPRYIFEAICRARGQEPSSVSPSRETMFYLDVTNALSSSHYTDPVPEKIQVESLDLFDKDRGTVALRLHEDDYLSRWRERLREVVRYNLMQFGGVDDDMVARFTQDEKLQWLFTDSQPHVTIADGVTVSPKHLTTITLPDYIDFTAINEDIPTQLTFKGLLLFDLDGAFDTQEEQAG